MKAGQTRLSVQFQFSYSYLAFAGVNNNSAWSGRVPSRGVVW
jgi:hypothetical protein